MSTIVRVATVNLLNDPSRWAERRGWIVEQLGAASPDLIGVQEVADPSGPGSTAAWLAGALGGFAFRACPKSGWSGRREGIAILSRRPIVEHAMLDLGSQARTAQFVRIEGVDFRFANGHFSIPWMLHRGRLRQAARLRDWLRTTGDDPAVVVGDFNALPGSPAIAAMGEAFASAHAAHHGREPEWTCPTPLETGGRAFRAAKTWGLRRFADRPGESWRGTLDYVFVDPRIRILDCGVILDQPAPGDPTLYASDHLGLAATLEVSTSS